MQLQDLAVIASKGFAGVLVQILLGSDKGIESKYDSQKGT
jgi:hypothetical protein